MQHNSTRRTFLACAAAALTDAAFANSSRADVPGAYSWDASPPADSRANFINWMQINRGEEPIFLTQRWSRFIALRENQDLPDARNARAFLMTPREEFVLKRDMERAYEPAYLDIGHGATISGPNIVGRMTSALDVGFGDKVLEIGTGSGYQSAYLANLTDRVWTIEVVKELSERARGSYDALIKRGYTEYTSITSKHADGYYGWKEAAPFDKIMVTCGIDHVPPPLLQQLKPGGIMVIPVGPPGAQHVLKVTKTRLPDGSVALARSDIFGGRTIRFVPLRRIESGGVQDST